MRQLRLALVCDGGVSLAIYMHGVTKELHKLVRASRAFDAAYDRDPAGAGSADNPFDSGKDTEFAYFEELRDLAVAGRPVSVVIDVVSGTSAGGINGVCLAKVIAGGGSQDALRELWMSKGDLRELLIAPRLGWLRLQIAVSLAQVAAGLVLGRGTYPLRGDRMARWLFDAITAMGVPAGASLVPDGNSLDLFVTTTDLDGFDVLVPAGGGGPSQHAVDHRQVLAFRYQNGEQDNFGPNGTGALAFAARATSAFPAAFPPASIDGFVLDLSGDGQQRDVKTASIVDRLQWQHPSEQRTVTAPCVDGGVLDNQPFDLVIDAIGGKRAETEVLRRLIYIEPVPGGALVPPAAEPAPPRRRGLLQDVKAALVNARGDQPVLRDLLHLRDINLRIGQIGDIVQQQMTEVLAAVTEAVAAYGEDSLSDLDLDGVRAVTAAMHKESAARLGPMYATYCRLKLGAAADEIADQVDVRFSYPPGSNRSSFARAVIHAWCHAQAGWEAGSQALIALLDGIDVPYRRRRLQFILAGINSLYAAARSNAPGTPTVDQLNTLKRAAWDLLDRLRDQTAETVKRLPDDTAAFLDRAALTDAVVLTDARAFAEEFGAQIAAMVEAYRDGMAPTVADMPARMWSVFTEQTSGWAPQARSELLSRFVGFPLWDTLIFPTIALAPVPQFTPIGVTRFSPLDAHRLDGDLGPKLKGVAWHHFGGFLDAEYRENDYLWGRLDGAELCLNTLRGGAGDQPSGASGDPGPHLDQALQAVVTAEHDLTHIPEMRARILARLQPPPNPAGQQAPQPEQSTERADAR